LVFKLRISNSLKIEGKERDKILNKLRDDDDDNDIVRVYKCFFFLLHLPF